MMTWTVTIMSAGPICYVVSYEWLKLTNKGSLTWLSPFTLASLNGVTTSEPNWLTELNSEDQTDNFEILRSKLVVRYKFEDQFDNLLFLKFSPLQKFLGFFHRYWHHFIIHVECVHLAAKLLPITCLLPSTCWKDHAVVS